MVVGEGHVARAVEQDQILISGDIRQTSVGQQSRVGRGGQPQLRLGPARPYQRDGKAVGEVTLSSRCVDHFTKPDVSAVLAFDTVAGLVSMAMLEVLDEQDKRLRSR